VTADARPRAVCGTGTARSEDRDLHLWSPRAGRVTVPTVTEVLISFKRPASLSETEVQNWISKQASGRQPELILSRRHLADGPVLLLRVALGTGSSTAADEQLADLVMDMRLLGLRPRVVSRLD